MKSLFNKLELLQTWQKGNLYNMLKNNRLMSHHVNITCCLCLFLLLCSASCREMEDIKQERWKRAEKSSGNIVIGAAAPWEWLADKALYRQGIDMAVEEINSNGGVLQRELFLVYTDDESSVDQGRVIAQDFAETLDMVAVIGHFNSHVSIPVSIMYQYYGLLMLSPASTAPELTASKGYNLIFRNIPTDSHMAAGLAEFCGRKEFKRIMIYGINNKWGISLANAFEYRAAELGIDIVDYRTFDFTSDAFYFKNDISQWRDFFQFDAIFLACSINNATEFIMEARKLGLDQPIIGGDGLDSPMLWEKAGRYAQGTIVGTYFHPDIPNKTTQQFVQRFREKYGALPDTWAAQGYDAVKLIGAAMEKAGSTVPPKVADAFRSMKDWQGVTGVHNFNQYGDVINKSIVIKKVDGNKFVYAENE